MTPRFTYPCSDENQETEAFSVGAPQLEMTGFHGALFKHFFTRNISLSIKFFKKKNGTYPLIQTVVFLYSFSFYKVFFPINFFISQLFLGFLKQSFLSQTTTAEPSLALYMTMLLSSARDFIACHSELLRLGYVKGVSISLKSSCSALLKKFSNKDIQQVVSIMTQENPKYV